MTTDINGIVCHVHYWSGKFYHVPQNFLFPKPCSLERGFLTMGSRITQFLKCQW